MELPSFQSAKWSYKVTLIQLVVFAMGDVLVLCLCRLYPARGARGNL